MDIKKPKKSRRKYDAAFKAEVITMIAAGRTVSDVARSLGVGENLIYRWKKTVIETSAIQITEPGTPQVTLAEHLVLQKKLREVEMERDILKKALGIFSRTP